MEKFMVIFGNNKHGLVCLVNLVIISMGYVMTSMEEDLYEWAASILWTSDNCVCVCKNILYCIYKYIYVSVPVSWILEQGTVRLTGSAGIPYLMQALPLLVSLSRGNMWPLKVAAYFSFERMTFVPNRWRWLDIKILYWFQKAMCHLYG